VVVFDNEDLAFAKDVHRRWPDVPFVLSVGNPYTDQEGDVAAALLDRCRALVDTVMNDDELANVRVLPQMHVLLWGNRRGV
jgi:7-carboxy-7-deazaguanine synthase